MIRLIKTQYLLKPTEKKKITTTIRVILSYKD